MAKRESRGQQVKTFKGYEPQPDMSSQERVFKVYFQASEGMFYIFLAEHIAKTVEALDIYNRVMHAERALWISPYYKSQNPQYQPDREGHVRAKVMEQAIETYEDVLKQYANLMRVQQRRKVIVFNYKANLRWLSNDDVKFHYGNAVTCADISFVGSPTLHLTYSVLYEANGVLYEIRREGTDREHMEYRGKIDSKDGKVIPWTQERENFLANLKNNLEQLILRVREFSQDLEVNIDRALAGRGAMAALAPPRTETGPLIEDQTVVGSSEIRHRVRTRT